MFKSSPHPKNSFLKNESYNTHLNGVSKASKLLQQAFLLFEKELVAGLIPQTFKEKFAHYLQIQGAVVKQANVALCRNGYLHPPVLDLEPLQEGEVITLDVYLQLEGWYADMARPYAIGKPTPPLLALQKAALACNLAAYRASVVGNTFFNIAQSVLKMAQQHHCFVLDGACGHGIGHSLHQKPEVAFNYTGRFLFSPLQEGMIFTLEPVVTLLASHIIEEKGLAKTHNHTPALFYETTITLTAQGPVLIGGFIT